MRAPVSLGGQGNGSATIFVPPLSGSVRCYLELARVAAFPCAGLVARGCDGEEEPLSCVESMAAAYIEMLAPAQSAPLRLVGWSFGGLVAFEMAKQLTDAHRQVHLTLLDCRALLVDSLDDTRLAPPTAIADDPKALLALQAVYGASLIALKRYTPSTYKGSLQVLRAAEEAKGDPALGWGEYCGQRVTTAEVPGSHYSMLDGAHAPLVAGLLNVNVNTSG